MPCGTTTSRTQYQLPRHSTTARCGPGNVAKYAVRAGRAVANSASRTRVPSSATVWTTSECLCRSIPEYSISIPLRGCLTRRNVGKPRWEYQAVTTVERDVYGSHRD